MKFFKFIYNLFPKTDLDRLYDETDKINYSNPENYGKLAMNYQQLHMVYALMLGRTDNDKHNRFMCDFYYDVYKEFRTKYFENEVEKKEK